MRKRRILLSIGVVALLALLVIWVYEPHNIPFPPTATFVSAEPSGMFDNSGAELLLVTFTINNTNRLEESHRHSNTMWVKDSSKPMEVRIRNGWSAAPPTSAPSTTFSLVAGQETQNILLAPFETAACRIWLQYTGERVSYPATLKGISLSIATKLPVCVRSRISYKFWRWAGFPKAVRGTKWKEVYVEFPVFPPSGAELGTSSRAE